MKLLAVAAAAAFAVAAAQDATPGPNPLDRDRRQTYNGEYHMKRVRAVHARVQSDSPMLVNGRFVSSFGKGDLKAGYLSGMDNVNTASVEGALMYVQAEGIDVSKRSAEQRCVRKNNMRNIVFYEVVISQTNETIAEFGESWDDARDAFEYGPMVPMDGGRCSDEKGKTPKACLQFNGDKGQPNLGPFVGGENKEDDVRAPYPGNYWFSFPNTCPTVGWADKDETCRKSTRKGLCDIGVSPDGVQCTFAYNILGWIPIDDLVAITSTTNEATGKNYYNFTEWCEASPKNIEFTSDNSTETLGLPFWDNPLDKKANQGRTETMLDIYGKIVNREFESKLINPKVLSNFRPLPEPAKLLKNNPKCWETVPVCSKIGCRREGYAQLCRPCEKGEDGCIVYNGYKFPQLAKAPRTATADEGSTSGSGGATAGGPSAGKSTDKPGKGSAATALSVSTAVASSVVALVAASWLA